MPNTPRPNVRQATRPQWPARHTPDNWPSDTQWVDNDSYTHKWHENGRLAQTDPTGPICLTYDDQDDPTGILVGIFWGLVLTSAGAGVVLGAIATISYLT